MKDSTAPYVCPVCGGQKRHIIAKLEGAKLQKCDSCDLVNVDYKAFEKSKEYYNKDYDILYNTYYKNFRDRQFKTFLDDIKQIRFPGRRLLDIGCSYGLFLNKAKGAGWETVGAEPSRRAFEIVSKQCPNEVYNYGIEKINEIPGTFDFITAWNVFEHIEQPDMAIDEIKNKLNKNGVLLLCIPDSKGLITMMSFFTYYLTFGIVRTHLMHLYQIDNDCLHLFHYNRKNLETLLRNKGFEPFFFKAQEIIDIKNIKNRIAGYARNNKLTMFGLSILLTISLTFSKMLQREDEIIVMARKV